MSKYKTNSIFQEPWWLDAITPGEWDVVEVKKDEDIRARMPYVMKRGFLGMKMITMPSLTQTLGPWIEPSKAKYAKRLAQQKDMMTALIEQLPPCDYFEQNFHYSITNWLPFYWKGFGQTTRYTYVIEDLKDLDKVWSQFQENIRTDIRKAKKQLVVRTDLNIERFVDINTMTFQRQGQKLPYNRNLVYRLDAACEEHNARRMFFSEDAKGRIHAAIYIVWDKDSAYYLMSGSDPELRNSGATSLLMWEAIQFAATITQKFDFEGSMIESVERFFRSFGAAQVPYFNIKKIMSHRMKLLWSARHIVRTCFGNYPISCGI